jgi:hypothetical protein
MRGLCKPRYDPQAGPGATNSAPGPAPSGWHFSSMSAVLVDLLPRTGNRTRMSAFKDGINYIPVKRRWFYGWYFWSMCQKQLLLEGDRWLDQQ